MTAGDAAAHVSSLAGPGPEAQRAADALFAAVTRAPRATVPALLAALDDLRPVAPEVGAGELRFSVRGEPISKAAVLSGERPRPLTVADLAALLVFNETRVDFGFRSDLPEAERRAAAEKLRAFWGRRG